MFRTIATISFLIVVGGILLHHWYFPCGYKPRFSPGSLIRKKVHLFTLLFPEQRLNWPGRFRKLAFLLGLLSFCVLLLTGFGPVVCGGRLHGWLLMIHATFAPVFIACAAFIAVTGAAQYAFSSKDNASIPSPLCQLPKRSKGCWVTDSGIGAKAGFWVLLVLSLPVTLTMVLSMLPLLGTDWQQWMFDAHRCSALAFALIALIELYILARMQILKDIHGRRDEPKT